MLQQTSNDYNAGVRFINEHTLGGFANRVVVGATPSWNSVSDDRFVNIAGRRGDRTGDSEQRSRNLTAYAEDQFGGHRA